MGICSSAAEPQSKTTQKQKYKTKSSHHEPSRTAGSMVKNESSAKDEILDIEATTGNDSVQDTYKFWKDKQKHSKRRKSFHRLPKDSAKPGESKSEQKVQRKLHGTLERTLNDTLGSRQLRGSVKLPQGEDINEWLAVNVEHFYNSVLTINELIDKTCTSQSCPNMCAGRKYQYTWKDNDKYLKPTHVSARVYQDLVFRWIESKMSDTELFPLDNSKFPSTHRKLCSRIMVRLFRLYAHIYYEHFPQFQQEKVAAHLNTCFKHFIFFVKEFDLIKDAELAPMAKIIAKF